MYPLPHYCTNPPRPIVGAFSVRISGDHNHVSRYKSNVCWQLGWIGEFYSYCYSIRTRYSFGAMPSLNIPGLVILITRLDLPLPDSLIGAFEPPLHGTIIHDNRYVLTWKDKIERKIYYSIRNNTKTRIY